MGEDLDRGADCVRREFTDRLVPERASLAPSNGTREDEQPLSPSFPPPSPPSAYRVSLSTGSSLAPWGRTLEGAWASVRRTREATPNERADDPQPALELDASVAAEGEDGARGWGVCCCGSPSRTYVQVHVWCN